jgi:hypothetical protein
MGILSKTGRVKPNANGLARSIDSHWRASHLQVIDAQTKVDHESVPSNGSFFTYPHNIRLEICTPTGATPAPVQRAPTCGFF